MKITVRNPKARLGFAPKGGGSWSIWKRYITVDNKDAYQIGNICGTCPFFFQRLEGANTSISPKEYQDLLTLGLSVLTDTDTSVLSELLPDGDYEMSLQFRVPRLVTPGAPDDYFCREQPALWGIDGFWGLPHHPRTKYYRGADRPMGDGARLFEFFIPMFPDSWLDVSRVAEFQARMNEGRCPTALAISILDIKQPADWVGEPEVTAHWCLAHYIIDGHHKLYAASRAKRPVGLVSMLALGQGIADSEQHESLIALLQEDPHGPANEISVL